jgi:transcriptional regulator with XRE-family HTH domain
MNTTPQRHIPEWSRKISALRKRLKSSQSYFGERLGISAMAVSRWERGETEPTAGAYIRLGNLAGDPLCWYFWDRAGLDTSNILRILPAMGRRLRKSKVPTLNIVAAGAGEISSLRPKDFVALPLLPIHAATHGETAEEVEDINQLTPEAMWAAPAEWCPNPASTISLRVKGNSMSPLILDGYIIAVDTADVKRDALVGQIVVALNRNTRQLLVSRLIRFDHTDALMSDQRQNVSVSVATESEWRIVGRVLWWTGRAR